MTAANRYIYISHTVKEFEIPNLAKKNLILCTIVTIPYFISSLTLKNLGNIRLVVYLMKTSTVWELIELTRTMQN